MDYKNTAPGYEPDNADVIPDEEDNGVGLYAGAEVTDEEHGDGIVLAVARGRGLFFGGQVVADVAFGLEPGAKLEDLDLTRNEDEEFDGFYTERKPAYSLEIL